MILLAVVDKFEMARFRSDAARMVVKEQSAAKKRGEDLLDTV